MPRIQFLSVEDVGVIHDDTIAYEGGLKGVRDPALLESAVMMPQQQFGGEYLHDGLAEMAAAYLFHIASNHPYLDGNKRAAVLSLLIFLDANGVSDLPAPERLEEVTLKVAAVEMGKEELTQWVQAELTAPTNA